MAPSNPKRPPRPPQPPSVSAPKKQEAELPFDDDEITPLQADDPRPQRVPQFPVGPRRAPRGPRGPRQMHQDRELLPRFDAREGAEPGHTSASLYVEKGPGSGQLIPVNQGVLVIGRASACDLRLQHPSISRRHVQLVRTGERFILRDLGSQNGTFINRVKIEGDTELRAGDELTLGNSVLKLRGAGGASTVAQTTAAPEASPARRPLRRRHVALITACVGLLLALVGLVFL
ncbi:FHA domain-containing protein [Stigmatella sp. ncwal1]|uniref:FHA domain-containing protein n=1 Tax=Stigmatella ashevillensis TaxID=2995309 RepID=A0ABT5DPM9_9BACT|nr:FHA domain-containing protein [Stigmatella ashevillena]MDC0715014.1 FHA domain-containing protein [Stigmatella ashevillena]